jgi:hypothetical protein
MLTKIWITVLFMLSFWPWFIFGMLGLALCFLSYIFCPPAYLARGKDIPSFNDYMGLDN